MVSQSCTALVLILAMEAVTVSLGHKTKAMIVNKVGEALSEMEGLAEGDDAVTLLAEDDAQKAGRHFRTMSSLDMGIEEYHGIEEDYEDSEQGQQQKQIVAGAGGDDENRKDSLTKVVDGRGVIWRTSTCLLSAGGDVLNSPRRLNLRDAKRLCAEAPECLGFTYEGSVPATSRRMVSFKDNFDCGEGSSGWTSLQKIVKEPPAAEAVGTKKATESSGVKPIKVQPVPHPPVWRTPEATHAQSILQAIGGNLTVLNADPPVWQLDGLLSSEEVAALQAVAAPLLGDADSSAAKGGFRDAKTAWLTAPGKESEVLEERLASLVALPRENQEPAQVLRYAEGGQYRLHHDLLLAQSRQPCGVRAATLFTYLTDVAEGGETVFPQLGLTVTPKAGRALLWWNVDPKDIEAGNKHTKDPRTEHEARPVLRGEKWGMNKWVHMSDFKTPYNKAAKKKASKKR